MRKITVLTPTPDLLLMPHPALETTTQQHVYWVSYVSYVCDISAGFSLVA